MPSLTHLQRGTQRVGIDAGELVSYTVDGHELIHQKGSPGWRSSDTEMFPIIGPTAEADFRVRTPRGEAVQDQHGLLRELPYALVAAEAEEAVFEKSYTAGTPVPNGKFPAKSTAEHLTWPYSFRFRKTFSLTAEGLVVTFVVEGEPEMPHMLGYHPAFRLTTAAPTIETADGRTVTLAEVLAVGSRALELADCAALTLHDARDLRIATTGFGHFMCWTEVPNMVCIEPITFYPYALPQNRLHEGMQPLGARRVYRVELGVGGRR